MEQLLFFTCFNNFLTFISPLGVNGAFKNHSIGNTFQTGIDPGVSILYPYKYGSSMLCKNHTQYSDFYYTQN